MKKTIIVQVDYDKNNNSSVVSASFEGEKNIFSNPNLASAFLEARSMRERLKLICGSFNNIERVKL